MILLLRIRTIWLNTAELERGGTAPTILIN
jgi:hypothetical protein